MIRPTDLRIINLMIEKCDRLIEITSKYSQEDIEKNYMLSDPIEYEFEKLYEDSTRLSTEFIITHPELPINNLRGIRNRVAHNYESVSLSILIDISMKDIPDLRRVLMSFIDK